MTDMTDTEKNFKEMWYRKEFRQNKERLCPTCGRCPICGREVLTIDSCGNKEYVSG